MAITHRHNIVLRDLSDREIPATHLDHSGREFGHDVHVEAMKDKKIQVGSAEHTHDDVWDHYDATRDQHVLVPYDPDVDDEDMSDEDKEVRDRMRNQGIDTTRPSQRVMPVHAGRVQVPPENPSGLTPEMPQTGKTA